MEQFLFLDSYKSNVPVYIIAVSEIEYISDDEKREGSKVKMKSGYVIYTSEEISSVLLKLRNNLTVKEPGIKDGF